MAAHNERNRRLLAPLGLAALAALTVVGCSTPEPAPTPATVTVTSAASPTKNAPTAQPPATAATPAPVTVTATPVAPPAPPAAPKPVVNQISGPFQSPSGNIRCNMYTSTDGRPTAMCSAAEHDWLAPKPDDCGANWGDRLDLEAGSPGRVACYGQGMPPATHTLNYGQMQQLGSITCTSDTVGIMCIDNDSGHFFKMSRQEYLVG